MTDTSTAAAAEAKPEREKMPEQNGITKPKPGTEIARVWDTATDLSTSLNRPATRAEVRDAMGDTINPATFATQYARWTKFYGVSAIIKQHRSQETTARKDAAKAEREKTKAGTAEERAAKKADSDKAKEQRKADAAAKKAEKQAAREQAARDKAAAKEQEKAAKAAADAAAKEAAAQAKANEAAAEQAPQAKKAAAKKGSAAKEQAAA